MARPGLVTAVPRCGSCRRCLWGLGGGVLEWRRRSSWLTDELDRPDAIDRVLASSRAAMGSARQPGRQVVSSHLVGVGVVAVDGDLSRAGVAMMLSLAIVNRLSRWPEEGPSLPPKLSRWRQSALDPSRAAWRWCGSPRCCSSSYTASLLVNGGAEKLTDGCCSKNDSSRSACPLTPTPSCGSARSALSASLPRRGSYSSISRSAHRRRPASRGAPTCSRARPASSASWCSRTLPQRR